MPKIVNPIIIGKLKRALKEGKSPRAACLIAGLAPNTAHTATSRKIVKDCIKELEAEFKASDLSVDTVVKDIEKGKRLAITGKKKDLSTFMRGCELEGKYLKMWTDNTTNNLIVISPENKLIRLNRLKSLMKDNKSNETKAIIDVEAVV